MILWGLVVIAIIHLKWKVSSVWYQAAMILNPWYGVCFLICIMSLYILLFTLYTFYFPDQYSHCNPVQPSVHWPSALLARQAQMTSPPDKANELWITHDCTHPQHNGLFHFLSVQGYGRNNQGVPWLWFFPKVSILRYIFPGDIFAEFTFFGVADSKIFSGVIFSRGIELSKTKFQGIYESNNHSFQGVLVFKNLVVQGQIQRFWKGGTLYVGYHGWPEKKM